MRRHVFFGLALLFTAPLVAPSLSAVAADGSYETVVTLDIQTGVSTVRHNLELPWSVPFTGYASDPGGWRGTMAVGFSQRPAGIPAWDGAFEAAGGPLRASLFFNRNHNTSSDPFKLVHASARDDASSTAAVLDWTANWSGTVQYVAGVPLRRRVGSVVAARLAPQARPFALTFVAYGSERVQHQFAVVDGRWQSLLGIDAQWGAAVQSGTDVDEGPGPGQIVHTPVRDGAAFLRIGFPRGIHGGWVRLHATGPRFRSLTADKYPFARGRLGVEGRWQWRPGGARLVSLYGQRLQPLPAPLELDGNSVTEHTLEVNVSTMPRGRWGWRLGGETQLADGDVQDASVELATVDPGRRVELTTRLLVHTSPLRWRHQLQWETGFSRLRLTVDGSFPGRRAEWRVHDYKGWDWTVVYKQRDRTATSAAADWFHVELSRHVATLGQLWVQYRAPDRGRLDVGWRRPVEVSGGVRVPF